MVTEASRINQASIESGMVVFKLSDGKTLDFASDSFHKVFTVNTVYFWEEPLNYAREILRVLNQGGKFYLTFVLKKISQRPFPLPYTDSGYTTSVMPKNFFLKQV